MSFFWERFFYFLTFLLQGASFLNPRAYAVLHRKHHAYSDTEKDPHSPMYFKSPWQMMLNTYHYYRGIVERKIPLEKELEQGYPEWKGFDEFADGRLSRVIFILSYIAIYVALKAEWWMYVFIPVHILMGPIHGAIVNWCGHKYGYETFKNGDNSKNSLPVDIVCAGELMQNNHHRYPKNINFAVKKFEFDIGHAFVRMMLALGIMTLSSQKEIL